MTDDEEEPLSDLVDEIDDDHSSDERPPNLDDIGDPGGTDDGTGPSEQRSSASADDRRSDGPLGDLAADLDRRREQRDDTIDDGLFDEEDVPEIDSDAVWEQIEAEEPTETPSEDPEQRVERVIDTGKYCERCEFFSDPPDAYCAHEGTEILEMVDIDHFRVVDCPIVAEDERMQDL